MNHGLTSSPIAHDRNVRKLLRPPFLLKEHRSRSGATADINERRDNFIGEILKQNRVAVFTRLDVVNKAHIPPPAIIRISTGIDVHERINSDIVNIAQPVCVDLHLGAIGTKANHPASEHRQFGAVGSFGSMDSKIPNRNVDPAIDTETEAIRGVIGTAILIVFWRTDIGEQNLTRSISDPIPVLVLE